MADMYENWHRYPVERPRHGGLYEVLYRNAGHLQAKDMVYAFGSKRFIASGRVTDSDVMMWREIESDLIPEETADTELEKAGRALRQRRKRSELFREPLINCVFQCYSH